MQLCKFPLIMQAMTITVRNPCQLNTHTLCRITVPNPRKIDRKPYIIPNPLSSTTNFLSHVAQMDGRKVFPIR